jgi:hypothetical protein
VIDWIRGDLLGIWFPAHAASLRSAGTAFLTEAMHAAGTLPADNHIAQITEFADCPGGSTGRKLLLSVAYAQPSPGLHTALFVKFSRDFSDEIRDRARTQMAREAQFALLSRAPAFPIVVPRCYFADYHHDTGTGILITQRIPYGRDGVEPHYDKCLDYRMPEPLQHYRALVTTIARLAGTHKAPALSGIAEREFPYDVDAVSVGQREPYNEQQIRNRVARYDEFAANFPQLLPDNIRAPAFLQRLADEAPRFIACAPAAAAVLTQSAELFALCHWNANVDNAWFWRGAHGTLECGLMDWGNVSQMNVAMALWGCLSAAEIDIWNHYLDDLLALFVSEFAISGGSALDTNELKRHILLYAGSMGLAWLLDAPPLIQRLVPDLADVKNRFDARISENETARAQLQIMTVFLNLWETQDMALLCNDLESQRR